MMQSTAPGPRHQSGQTSPLGQAQPELSTFVLFLASHLVRVGRQAPVEPARRRGQQHSARWWLLVEKTLGSERHSFAAGNRNANRGLVDDRLPWGQRSNH
jgi:hypothetical protein